MVFKFNHAPQTLYLTEIFSYLIGCFLCGSLEISHSPFFCMAWISITTFFYLGGLRALGMLFGIYILSREVTKTQNLGE